MAGLIISPDDRTKPEGRASRQHFGAKSVLSGEP
jgi:hypothetical protein